MHRDPPEDFKVAPVPLHPGMNEIDCSFNNNGNESLGFDKKSYHRIDIQSSLREISDMDGANSILVPKNSQYNLNVIGTAYTSQNKISSVVPPNRYLIKDSGLEITILEIG